MNSDDLKRLQAPLKAQYSESPASAKAQLQAGGTVDLQNLTCCVDTPGADTGSTTTGLHMMAGGDEAAICAGDMLLQSLVGCAGVTLAAVATAMGLNVRSARIQVVGEMDFRGTLGVDRETPVGFTDITVSFAIASDESDEKIAKLIELTERYCVVLQTLRHSVSINSARVPVTA